MSDTLAQKHLIELLVWNASNVHKHFNKTWQEELDDPTWNSVRSMLSTSLLKGMFWCRWTSRNWPKVIPDRDNSAEKWKVQMDDMEVLGLSLFPFLKKLAGTSRWSAVISQALDRCLRWHLTYPCSRCPLLSKKFYIFSDGSHTQLAHTQLTHTQLAHTHTTYSHTTCTHTQLTHTQLTHTQTTYSHTTCTHTHNLLTHNLHTHTQLTHTQLAHTHNLLTRNLHTHTQLTHTQLAHTHTQLTHTQLVHTHTQLVSSFHVAGVVLAHNLSSHHLLTHNLSSHNLLWRGRRGTYGTGLALVARLLLGVAPGRRGCWRGRRGTWKHPSSFHVAGVVLGDIDFYWRGRRGTYGTGLALVARLVSDVAPGRRGCWRGRRGTWRHPSSFHVAGVVLPHNLLTHNLHTHTQLTHTQLAHTHTQLTLATLAWQVCHLWHWAGSDGALGFRCGAGTPRLLAWQAWHLETSIFF